MVWALNNFVQVITFRVKIVSRNFARDDNFLDCSGGQCGMNKIMNSVKNWKVECDDILRLAQLDGVFKEIFPDLIREKMVSSHKGIAAYRVAQVGAHRLEIAIATAVKGDVACDQIVTAVIQSLNSLWDRVGVRKPDYVFTLLGKNQLAGGRRVVQSMTPRTHANYNPAA